MSSYKFSELYKDNYTNLLKFAQNLTQSRFDAEDILQDASIKAVNNVDSLNETVKFRPWFQRIIYNVFITKYHKRKRRKTLLEGRISKDDVLFSSGKSMNRTLQRLNLKDIKKAFRTIEDKYSDAFRLHYRGYSYKEIAAIEDIAIGTVKSRIHTAKQKIRTIISPAA